MIEIPVAQTKSADFTQEIELGLQILTLRIVWNVRNSFFFLSVTNPEGEAFGDLKMVPHWPLFSTHRALAGFEGDFILLAKTEDAGPLVTYDNLGEAYGLYYLTPTEVSEWKALNGLG